MIKNFKVLSLLVALLATTCFTSCLDDDDDDDSSSGLSASEIAQAYSQMAGTHSLKCYLIDSENSTTSNVVYADTSDVTLSVTSDSVMYIRNFPVRMLAEAITDSEVAEAVRTASNQTLTCYSYYYQLSPVSFIVNPVTISTTLNYGGEDHTVKIGFLVNSYYSYGVSSGSYIGIQLYEVAYQVDSNSYVSLSNYGVFHLLSE